VYDIRAARAEAPRGCFLKDNTSSEAIFQPKPHVRSGRLQTV